MTERRCLMVVHAHPDDEVFRTGGIMAKYAAAGDRVVAVYCTRGEAGEMHDPDLEKDEAKARLGDIREEEVRRACKILGVEDVYFLGYRDSGMRDSDENQHPEAFVNSRVEEAADRLFEMMETTRPQVVVTYDEYGEKGYEHPDHVMTNRVTVAAFERAQKQPWAPEKLYYGASSREGFKRWIEGLKTFGLTLPWLKGDFNFDEHGIPDDQITTHIDISRFAALKKRALAAHRSQIPADFFYVALPDEALARYAGVEYFMRVHPSPNLGERETDLFAGTRVEAAAA